jgi:hypothetical protein
MQHFRKYELTPTQWATAKAKIEKTYPDMDGGTETVYDPEKVVSVVEIGKLCTEWGTNEEGQQVCTKYASKISVDILWAGEPLTTGFARTWYGPSLAGYTYSQAGKHSTPQTIAQLTPKQLTANRQNL